MIGEFIAILIVYGWFLISVIFFAIGFNNLSEPITWCFFFPVGLLNLLIEISTIIKIWNEPNKEIKKKVHKKKKK